MLTFLASLNVLTFFVAASVDAGMSPSRAGTLLAAASVTSIVARLLAGLACDTAKVDPLKICAGMLAAGSLGLLRLASGRPGAMALGVFIALVGTWGFMNAFWLALMRAYPESPGRATGAMAPAIFLGGGLGPAAFGVLIEAAGYRSGWIAIAVAAMLGSIAYLLTSSRLPGPQLKTS